MICPMLIKGHQSHWILKHSDDFQCFEECAWHMFGSVPATGYEYGVCAIARLAQCEDSEMPLDINAVHYGVTAGEQSHGTESTG